MTRGEIIDAYRRMSADDQVAYRRWLATNSVIASVFVAALVAVIIFQPGAGGNSQDAQSAHGGSFTTAAK